MLISMQSMINENDQQLLIICSTDLNFKISLPMIKIDYSCLCQECDSVSMWPSSPSCEPYVCQT